MRHGDTASTSINRTITGRLARFSHRMRTIAASASPAVVAALAVVCGYVAVALLAPWIAPYGESEIVGQAYLPASSRFFLGTDQLGRDVLSRMVFGARNSIGIAVATTTLSFAIGVPLGILASLKRGWTKRILNAVVDVVVAVPMLVFALLFLAVAGRGTLNLVVIIALLDSARVYIVSRNVSSGIASQDFVEAALLRGEGTAWVMLREVLPNMSGLLAAEFGLRFGFVFLTIAALSFLGIGIQPPTADWGSMISDSKSLLTYGVLAPFYPATALVILVVAVNLLVDWLQQLSNMTTRDG